MTTFGLITEGKTDQIIIENILVGYFKDPDIMINWLLPLRDETDKHRIENYSNWFKVFEYCKSVQFKKSFQFNDYVIVQIDTDVSEEKHYDIPKYEHGKELEPEILIQRVIDKFKNLIGAEFFGKFGKNIIFAISVHSVECWLLPLYYKDKKKSKTKNCLDTLNLALKRRHEKLIHQKDKHADIYENISTQYCKHKILMSHYKDNPSLKIFIEEIQTKTGIENNINNTLP